MTLITVQDGKIVLRDGKVGTGAGCCCGEGDVCPPGQECCGYYEYRIDYCELVDGDWVVTGTCPPGGAECLPCECCNGFDSSVFFEGYEPSVDRDIRILECQRFWCDEVPEYCCQDRETLTEAQQQDCDAWWNILSGTQAPNDSGWPGGLNADAECAANAPRQAYIVLEQECYNPLP